MQNKFSIPLRTTLICFLTGACLGIADMMFNNLIALSFIPGLSMGYFFARIHRDFTIFQKRWKSYLIFSLAYVIAVYTPVILVVNAIMEKWQYFDADLMNATVWHTKGLIGGALLLISFRLFFKIHFRLTGIVTLLLCSSASAYFFYAEFMGDGALIAGFAVWQGIVGGLLSWFIVNSKPDWKKIETNQIMNS
jgi:hypothetical protein